MKGKEEGAGTLALPGRLKAEHRTVGEAQETGLRDRAR